MRDIGLMTMMLVLPVATSYAEPGFDQRYERNYNIFNPITQYQPDTRSIRPTSMIHTAPSIP